MLRVSYIYWEPWFRGHPPALDLKNRAEVVMGMSGVFAADVVVVHAPSLLSSGQTHEVELLRRNTRPEQVWILVTQESSENYPEQASPGFRSLFDGEMSHRQTAEIWIPYLDAGSIGVEFDPAEKTELCCAFMSSGFNASRRQEYLASLMHHVDVASFGRVQNNRRIADDGGRMSKLAVMRRFRYAIAFENSRETDYVTEKFFDPLGVGTIPIYLGAPNIGEFCPGDECCIDASAHPDPRTLARLILERDYRDLHRWRQQPLRLSFMEKSARLAVPFHERFLASAEALRERKRKGPCEAGRGLLA
jgi:hypothetical protein